MRLERMHLQKLWKPLFARPSILESDKITIFLIHPTRKHKHPSLPETAFLVSGSPIKLREEKMHPWG